MTWSREAGQSATARELLLGGATAAASAPPSSRPPSPAGRASATCLGSLGTRSAGWHHAAIEVNDSAATARGCVDSNCYTESGFDLPVDVLWFNVDDLDAYLDDFVVTALP